MKIELDAEQLRYTGRIDDRNQKKPGFIFPATSLEFWFVGKAAYLTLTNKRVYWDSYLGIRIDGREESVKLNSEGETRVRIVEEETAKEHHVLIYKRMDNCHEFTLEALELSDDSKLLELPPELSRCIEVYGDSISAGEVVEALDYVGEYDPEHEGEYSNSWYAYSWQLARKLGAQLHDIAQGGIALMNGTGWFYEPQRMGMESVWDKVHYNPQFGETTEWDFSRFRPQLVIVALGQNDNHPDDFMKEKPDGEMAKRWKIYYEGFLRKLRNIYPDAHIICMTSILIHDSSWDRAIEEVCSKVDDKLIHHYMFKRNGAATKGHPRIPEDTEMADELYQYIEKLNIQW